MSEKVRLALDVMGGDFGPSSSFRAQRSLSRGTATSSSSSSATNVRSRRCWRQPAGEGSFAGRSRRRCHPIWTTSRPSTALTAVACPPCGKAMDEVKFGRAAAAVSAGNTGRADGNGRLQPEDMEGVGRPALAALWPTLRGETPSSSTWAPRSARIANALVDMAVMGGPWPASFSISSVRPSACSISGVEEVKGLEFIREAGQILRDADLASLDYRGFVEGDDIGKGITTWWSPRASTGNIAPEDGRGDGQQIGEYLRSAMSAPGAQSLAISWRVTPFPRFARRWIRARATEPSSSASTRVVIKSHAEPIRSASPAPSTSPTDMARYDLQSKIVPCSTPTMHRDGPTCRSPRGRIVTSDPWCAAWAAICPHASGQMPSSRLWSTPPTSGSCSAGDFAKAHRRRG